MTWGLPWATLRLCGAAGSSKLEPAKNRIERYTGGMKLQKILFSLALAGASVAAVAQWQWIDKDGRKVYSDRGPPQDIPEKNIVKRPPGRTPANPVVVTDSATPSEGAPVAAVPVLAASAPKTALDKEIEAKKKAAADAELAKKKADEERIAKVKIENCMRAKQAKATLDSGVRMGRVSPSGEREVLDDAARATEAKRIQGIMASDCGP